MNFLSHLSPPPSLSLSLSSRSDRYVVLRGSGFLTCYITRRYMRKDAWVKGMKSKYKWSSSVLFLR